MMPISCAVLLASGTLVLGWVMGRRYERRGTRSLIPFVVLALAASGAAASPPEAVAAAAAHNRTLAADAAYWVRYLDVSHFSIMPQASPDAHGFGRPDAERALAYHINSLSRESDIVRPGGIASGSVLAIDLRDYGIDRLTWEKLVNANEPYFHVQVAVTKGGGVDQYQRPLPKVTTYAYATAPWLPAADMADLVKRTGSQIPIVRGDWFLVQTAIQVDRVVGYYDFLGLGKKEADFQDLIAADPVLAKKRKLEIAAAVAKSGVAKNNRGIGRLQSLTGGYWFTQDFKTSTQKQNVGRLLAGDFEPPKGDASEQIGVLPNKLHAFWLQDKDGNRQDVVPQNIALDNKTPHNDKNIYAGTISCTRCHIEGFRPIDDWVRDLYSGDLELRSPDYEKYKKNRQLYATDLKGQLAADNASYAAAVHACNGLDVAANARLMGEVWETYVEFDVTPAKAAAELGCEEPKLLAAVELYAQREAGPGKGVIDPVISAFKKKPPRPIRREWFEETYPFFQKIMGAVP